MNGNAKTHSLIRSLCMGGVIAGLLCAASCSTARVKPVDLSQLNPPTRSITLGAMNTGWRHSGLYLRKGYVYRINTQARMAPAYVPTPRPHGQPQAGKYSRPGTLPYGQQPIGTYDQPGITPYNQPTFPIQVQGSVGQVGSFKVQDGIEVTSETDGVLYFRTIPGNVSPSDRRQMLVTTTLVRQQAPAPQSVPAQTQKSQKAGLTMHAVRVVPTSVRGGEPYGIEFEYTVFDPKAGTQQIPIQFVFRVLDDTTELFKSKTYTTKSRNGLRTTFAKKNLPSTTTPGTYKVEVSLIRGTKMFTGSADLIVE